MLSLTLPEHPSIQGEAAKRGVRTRDFWNTLSSDNFWQATTVGQTCQARKYSDTEPKVRGFGYT